MRRIIAQARKELTQLFRDRLTVVLALVLPLILMALLGTAISLTVTDLPVVIQDLDDTPLSRQFADTFRASLTFRLVSLPVTIRPEEAFEQGRARAAVIIPAHCVRVVRRGHDADVRILVDQ